MYINVDDYHYHYHYSPGHRPSGVLDNQLMGCWLIVPPIVPQWSPGLGELIPRWWACLLFSIFWPPKKSSKIRPLKKSTFLAFLAIFGDFATIFSGFWVYFGIPRGSFFDFFDRWNFQSFFHCFFQKNQKTKKVKSGFRPIKYDTSWGSPCWKKCEGGFKKTSFFLLSFHPKSTENQSKNRGKRHSLQKSMKKRSLGRLFWEKVDFWWCLASPGGPKNCWKSTVRSR